MCRGTRTWTLGRNGWQRVSAQSRFSGQRVSAQSRFSGQRVGAYKRVRWSIQTRLSPSLPCIALLSAPPAPPGHGLLPPALHRGLAAQEEVQLRLLIQGGQPSLVQNPRSQGTNPRGIYRMWWNRLIDEMHQGSDSQEMALCYYASQREKEAKGWIYLKDITEIIDSVKTFSVVSAARTLVLEAKTTGEHSLWLQNLAAFCPNADSSSVKRYRSWSQSKSDTSKETDERYSPTLNASTSMDRADDKNSTRKDRSGSNCSRNNDENLAGFVPRNIQVSEEVNSTRPNSRVSSAGSVHSDPSVRRQRSRDSDEGGRQYTREGNYDRASSRDGDHFRRQDISSRESDGSTHRETNYEGYRERRDSRDRNREFRDYETIDRDRDRDRDRDGYIDRSRDPVRDQGREGTRERREDRGLDRDRRKEKDFAPYERDRNYNRDTEFSERQDRDRDRNNRSRSFNMGNDVSSTVSGRLQKFMNRESDRDGVEEVSLQAPPVYNRAKERLRDREDQRFIPNDEDTERDEDPQENFSNNNKSNGNNVSPTADSKAESKVDFLCDEEEKPSQAENSSSRQTMEQFLSQRAEVKLTESDEEAESLNRTDAKAPGPKIKKPPRPPSSQPPPYASIASLQQYSNIASNQNNTGFRLGTPPRPAAHPGTTVDQNFVTADWDEEDTTTTKSTNNRMSTNRNEGMQADPHWLEEDFDN
jgi:hypothetical protein